jgi:hypothetical protein
MRSICVQYSLASIFGGAISVSISHPPVVEIKDHCSVLSELLSALAYQEPARVSSDGETYGWTQPAEWLDLAASITKVDVLTAQGDQSVIMCGRAMDYENDRSELLAQFATSLTVFSFVWGAFESVAKLASPPSIPKEFRKDGNDGLVARVAYAVQSVKPDGVYYCGLANLLARLTRHPEYKDFVPADLDPVTDANAGRGIDLVRRIRNKFAHGAAALPQRDDWNGKDSLDNQLVRFSCRLVLLTVQMMLRVYYKDRSFKIEVYQFRSDWDDEAPEIHTLLETLHLAEEIEE